MGEEEIDHMVDSSHSNELLKKHNDKDMELVKDTIRNELEEEYGAVVLIPGITDDMKKWTVIDPATGNSIDRVSVAPMWSRLLWNQ